MSNIMSQYEKEAAEKAKKEAQIEAILNMLRFGVNKEQILTIYDEELYNLAVSLTQNAKEK